MNFKDIPPFQYILNTYRFFKKIQNNLAQIQQSLYFVENDDKNAGRRFYYKQIISENHTAWYENFEKAVIISNIVRPKVVVDLGVDHGFSTFSFAYAGHGNIYGLDSFEGDIHAGHRDTYKHVLATHEKLKSEFQISDVTFIKGYFEDTASSWEKKIDILHIDGLHTYEAVKGDFETWKKFFNHDTVVLFHDTISFKDTVGKFFSELDGYKYCFNDGCGLGVWSKSENFIRQIRYIYN